MPSRTLFIVLACLGLPVSAADSPEPVAPATEIPATSAQANGAGTDPLLEEAAAAAATPSPSGPSEESFTPTIQISEDLSVSFPVDI